MKHTWRLDEYGKVDRFALEYGFHNGPVCTVCGEGFCVHCSKDKGRMDEECEGAGMGNTDAGDIIAAIEAEIKAAEQKVAELLAAGEQEALKIEEAVISRLKALLAKVMSAL